jgi:hypothetical protein
MFLLIQSLHPDQGAHLKQGQKVVCIDDRVTPKIRSLYVHWVTKGTTYLVRDVMLAQNSKGEWGEVGLTLAGLVNPTQSIPPYQELSYNSERFRPLEEKPAQVEELEEVGPVHSL